MIIKVPDHLGSSSYITDANGEVSQHLEYFAFGETFVEEHSNKDATPYLYNAKELDEETGLYYYGARYYDPVTSVWQSVDPLWEQVGANRSPYEYTYSNPINLIDPDGRRPIPLCDIWKGWTWKVDSWFGTRNTGLRGASRYHRGIDLNYSGGGNTDYGAPVLTTHDGKVTKVHNSKKGGAGRYIEVTSPDGKFRTRYFHLKEIHVKKNQQITESTQIGELGGSSYGKEFGRIAHLHYEIQKIDEDGNWKSVSPTSDAKNTKKIIDPQSWIKGSNQEKNSSKTNWSKVGKDMSELSKGFKQLLFIMKVKNKG